MIKCNLHGFRFYEAIKEVQQIIEICLTSKDKYLLVIHGYRRGGVLKNYICSKEFLEDMADEGYILREINHPNPGATMFEIINSN